MVNKAQRAAKQAKVRNRRLKQRTDWENPEFWTDLVNRVLKEVREART